jgi:hypothetical protein
MRRLIWILLGVISYSFIVLMVFVPYVHDLAEPALSRLATVAWPVFILIPLGGFWMLYQSVRYENKPLFCCVLALFVPFAWIWYYFERARPRRRVAQSTGITQK